MPRLDDLLALASLDAYLGECQECEGRGERTFDGPVAWQSGIPFETTLTVECPACEGTGLSER